MIYRFSDCELDTEMYTLHRAGQRIPLRPKALHMLRVLLEVRHRVVSKEELCAAVWPNQAISDATLSSTLRAVRQAVGDSGEAQRYIYTLPGYGYRFIAAVVQDDPALAGRVGTSVRLALEMPVALPQRPPEPVVARPATAATASTRRQLTVLWCDLRDITSLTGPLDPEMLRDVLRAAQDLCSQSMARYAGFIAQQLGDGVLVYFGYPQAQEDAANRAVQAALECVQAVAAYQARLGQEHHIHLVIRLGIHTGLVVMDTLGSDSRAVPLAVGNTPIVATRLPELAEPNTVVISDTTARLVGDLFLYQDRGPHVLPSMADPVHVYRVLGTSGVQHRLDGQPPSALSPLIGRTVELALLEERWQRVTTGQGQVVLVSGEPGIGKSRLVWELRRQVERTEVTSLVFRCSPYHTHSAFYPVLTALQRLLQWQRHDTPQAKLAALERLLEGYRFVQPEVVPLLASLLSLPWPSEPSPLLRLSPQQQRQRTQDVLIAWLLEAAERQPILMVWEDLHWVDPSTLELLGRLVSQVASARVLVVLTFRPGFQHAWGANTHFSQLVLPRLTPLQVEAMLSGILTDQTVPAELIAHVMTATDGVPLFIEELTKMLLETGRLRQTAAGYALTDLLPLHAIPVTLYDTLLARLERLSPGAEVARVAAVLGREFSATVLQAVAPLAAETVQQGLLQLVEADLVMPQGRYPTRGYRFKHALVQEAAYQSVPWRTRQQYHQHIAQVLENRFPELVPTQPELLAHHYTEAGCPAQAVGYWLRAGQYAIERSAALEAIAHLHKGLEVLTALPDTRERWQHELDMQIALGAVLMATRGWADPELARAYTRARQLCQTLDNLPQHFWALQGLWNFYTGRGELHTAQTLAEHMLTLAQHTADPTMLSLAHHSLGITFHYLGTPLPARWHLDQGMALHDPAQHRAPTRLQDEQHWHIAGRSYMVYLLWACGFPEQARGMLQHTLHQAMAWAYPSNMAFVFTFATILHQLCREIQAASTRAEALMALATEQGFPHWGAMGLALRGWALAMHGQGEEGIAQLRRGLHIWQALGVISVTPYLLTLLAEAYGTVGQPTAGQAALAEAQALVKSTGERWWEAELHRQAGELLLAQAGAPPQATGSRHKVEEATACFQQALDIARQQHTRSLELRAAMSLSRLWQQQGKRHAAYELLADVYGWFTEGFDTANLLEAKALLDELA